ncbi:TDP-N-acetylfucosamine:lipid II N-acetylfucosaminyltransferase [Aestuariivivens sediminis]|uniref:TDP-N-acetylfucosamine:lipid II N-acetylfucosaminyltransferase n=1 Tax=Aestuariivivens sediminis TaxID=2913557 RepID=UPI001F563DDF|nr:TDP-N-acetylfucosamine:lipid II N-acetylfucosaminyltransferase [Aestuariivivens sediminis]
MGKYIIHIAKDEKFITAAWMQFEGAFPNRNMLYIGVNNLSSPLLYVNELPVNKILFNDLILLAKDIASNHIVVLHSLPSLFYDFVIKLRKNIKVIWLCYGYEVYNDPNYYSFSTLFAQRTYANIDRIKSLRPFNKRWKQVAFMFPSYLIPNKVHYYLKQQVVFKRIQILGTSFQEEFDSISNLTKNHFSFLKYWHYPLEHIVDIDRAPKINSPYLLIGNSAAASNNHLDVFEMLKDKELSQIEKVVLPLNYGDNGLKDIIDQEAKLQFGERYYPLHDFLTLDAYNEVLANCGIGIFYTKRQQAIGNTLALIWYGASVFLSLDNPFYNYLRRLGVIVYSIEKDLALCNQLNYLPRESILSNRKLLFGELTKSKLISHLRNALNANIV